MILAITGGSRSLTVTVKLQVAVCPVASIAVQLTVVATTGKTEAEGGLQTTVTPLSAAEGEKLTTLEHWPGSVATAMLSEQVIVGGEMPFTVMMTVATLDVALPSEAVKVNLSG